MAVPVSTKPAWHFGVFEVDIARGELRRSGIPLKLRDQSFQILQALLERPGEIVTREELRSRLWPSDTFVDFDHSLNTAMMKLRDALGDSTGAPIYIETIPKRGYRFIAPVSPADDTRTSTDANIATHAADTPTAALQQTPHTALVAARRLRWLTRIELACLVLILAAGALLWIYQRRAASGDPATFRNVPVTTVSGLVLGPSLSPSGREVAYVWDGPERSRFEMFVQFIGSPQPLRVTYEGGRMGIPAWSPEGHDIAFTRCDLSSSEGAIIVVSALGGPENRITTSGCPYNLPSPVAWSPIDGGRLLFIDHCVAGGPWALVSFSLATGNRDCLVDSGPPGFTRRFDFSLSPDGKRVAFNPSTDGPCDIYTIPLTGGTPKHVLHEDASCTYLMWAPDGHEIVYVSQRTTLSSVWRVPENGGQVRKEPIYPTMGRFSADGRRFVYEQVVVNEPLSIWRIDLAAPGGAVLANRKLVASQSSEVDAQPSPDGTRIVWMSDRTGPNELWLSDADGRNPRQLTRMNSYAGTPRWSPDGKWIAFDFDKGSAQIFVIDAEGRNLHQVTSGSGVNVVPSWSRDGNWIYFASERTGRKEIWKHALESGEELQVTRNGGFNAFESFDGRTIYFAKFDHAGIWSVPSQGGAETVVLKDKPQTEYWGQWALTRTGIYFMNVESEPRARIDFYDFATRRTRPIMVLDKLPAWAQPSLSATDDGKIIYYAQHEVQKSARMIEFQP